MEYCKYHPVVAATYQCTNCHTFNCDDCCHYTGRSSQASCYLCRNELSSLGVSNNVTPFWRRLQESFTYPVNFESILLIIGLAVLSTIANYMPFSFLISLLLTSALLKYSFSCLENTSHGVLEAPDVTQAYGGGFGLALQVIFMVIAILGIIWVTNYFLGSMLASLVAIVLIAGFPAMIINFAMTENFIQALNPMSMLRMMASIGLPYGLLLAFILIMSGSVGVISQFIGHDFSLVSSILQSIVSNYYTIVVFHMMGYMIYQYQDELGIERISIVRNNKSRKSLLEDNLSHIDILLKEGKLEEAIVLYDEVILSNPEEKNLKSNFFELLLVTKSSKELDRFAPKYFDYLLQSNSEDKLPISYQRVIKVNPKFNPETAEQRFKLAQICQHRGDSKSVIRLVNGLHKSHPAFNQLSEAYTMMANALDDLPNMQAQADKCRKLITGLS
ncbi:MAG: DUF4013 domain-containing protein [Proteobacteria bacterium]|nr:DUF4013 domain-containing protein [Pseudomonadota bacterium]